LEAENRATSSAVMNASEVSEVGRVATKGAHLDAAPAARSRSSISANTSSSLMGTDARRSIFSIATMPPSAACSDNSDSVGTRTSTDRASIDRVVTTPRPYGAGRSTTSKPGMACTCSTSVAYRRNSAYRDSIASMSAGHAGTRAAPSSSPLGPAVAAPRASVLAAIAASNSTSSTERAAAAGAGVGAAAAFLRPPPAELAAVVDAPSRAAAVAAAAAAVAAATRFPPPPPPPAVAMRCRRGTAARCHFAQRPRMGAAASAPTPTEADGAAAAVAGDAAGAAGTQRRRRAASPPLPRSCVRGARAAAAAAAATSGGASVVAGSSGSGAASARKHRKRTEAAADSTATAAAPHRRVAFGTVTAREYRRLVAGSGGVPDHNAPAWALGLSDVIVTRGAPAADGAFPLVDAPRCEDATRRGGSAAVDGDGDGDEYGRVFRPHARWSAYVAEVLAATPSAGDVALQLAAHDDASFASCLPELTSQPRQSLRHSTPLHHR